MKGLPCPLWTVVQQVATSVTSRKRKCMPGTHPGPVPCTNLDTCPKMFISGFSDGQKIETTYYRIMEIMGKRVEWETPRIGGKQQEVCVEQKGM